MKYIVLNVISKSGMGMDVPFVFPDIIVHSMMAHVCVDLCKMTWGADVDVTPISAGFLSSTAFEDECYGESMSLGLKSRPEDSRLIKMCDYGSMHA